MPVTTRPDLAKLVNSISLNIAHFALGTFPEADGKDTGSLPVNRLLFILKNPDGEQNFIRDAIQHFPLREGMAYFIPLYHPVRIRLSRDLVFLSVQFRLELHRIQDLFSGVKRVMELKNMQEWRTALLRIFEEKEIFHGGMQLQNTVFDIAAHLLSLTRQEEQTPFHVHSHYGEVLRFAQKNCSASLSVTDLANFCGERRETFTRKFTAETGIPPKHFLTRLLLAKAYDLLSRNDLLIKEIAQELGFANEFYFSRFIRKHTGKSPVRFRAEHCSAK